MTDDRIPTIEVWRGIGLHDGQDEARLAVVRDEIDKVFAAQDQVGALLEWVENRSRSPELRLLAAALIKASWETAAEQRRVRPLVDLERVDALVAGLDSARWRDRLYFDTMLAPRHGPNSSRPRPVRRPEPLL